MYLWSQLSLNDFFLLIVLKEREKCILYYFKNLKLKWIIPGVLFRRVAFSLFWDSFERLQLSLAHWLSGQNFPLTLPVQSRCQDCPATLQQTSGRTLGNSGSLWCITQMIWVPTRPWTAGLTCGHWSKRGGSTMRVTVFLLFFFLQLLVLLHKWLCKLQYWHWVQKNNNRNCHVHLLIHSTHPPPSFQ